MDDKSLVQAALDARERAYVPYSKFKVGAALITEDGTLFKGCNVENASYGLACCAERTAIFKAVSEGHHKVVKLAVVADTEGPASPCGACRQVMNEFGPDARLIMTNLQGDTLISTPAEMLPGAFGPGDLLKEKRNV